MKERIEGESPLMHPEIKDAVKNAFRCLSERLKGENRIFVDKDGNKRYLILKNPAGNLSVHSYETGDDYVLICDKCAEDFNMDQLWSDFDTEKLKEEELKTVDLELYRYKI